MTNFSSGASSSLLENKYLNKLIVNKLIVNKLKVNNLFENDNIKPLVYYSIPGNNIVKFSYIYQSLDNTTKEYHLKIPKTQLQLPVTKRIERYSPKIESYWSLISSAEKLLSDVTLDFKQFGPTYNIDNIGGIVPNSYRGGLSVLQILYFEGESNQAYMTNFFIQNLELDTDFYIFTLHYVNDAKTYPHVSHEDHPKFNDNHHHHVNPIENEIINKAPPSSEFSVEKWALELYQSL